MKRAITFLLVLLLVAGGLCYAVDTAIRTLLANGIQKVQDKKNASIASWEYDSFSRRLVLHDVRYPLPEKDATVTAREVQATVSLRAALHSLSALDFLLSSQSYLTLLDDWQGTEVSCEQSSPEGDRATLTIGRVEGDGLAILGEQFKKFRKGSRDLQEALTQIALRSLLLEKAELTWIQKDRPSRTLLLHKGMLEKWDTQGRIGSIRLEKCAVLEEGEPPLRMGSLTVTDLMPRTLVKLGGLEDGVQIWDALIEDIPFTSLAMTDVDLRASNETCHLGRFEIARAEKARRLKQISLQNLLLKTPDAGGAPLDMRFDEFSVQDLSLPASKLLGEMRAVEDLDRLEVFLAGVAQEPIFTRALIKSLNISTNGIAVALELLDNTWTQDQGTQTLTSTMTNFRIPTTLLAASPIPVKLPGLKELRFNASGTHTFTGEASRLEGKFTADSLCDLEYAYEMQGKSILGPWTGLRHLDIRLTDKGLMPIVALNVDQDPAVAQMSLDTLAQMLAANLPNGTAVLPALKTFIATPGELKIGITGDDWIPVQADNPLWLLQLVTRLQVESTPGKTPLADLVKARLEKAGN